MNGEIASALERFFAGRDATIAAAWLFGSTARGTATPSSDVDVAILPRVPQRGSLDALHLDLEGDLERLLAREVQLVVMDDAPVDLIHRILRDGILLCDHDRSRRIAFEVRARNEYFDLLPILQRYRSRAS